MPLNDRDVSKTARLVMDQHGPRAQEAIAEKIGYLQLLGDAKGVTAWKAIAARLTMMTNSGERPQQ